MKFNLNSISYKDLKTCRYLLRFSYIGTNYTGIQRQTVRGEDIPEGYDNEKDPTIQYHIEKAIETQLRPIFGSRLALSSRTDTGVHALVNSGHIDLTHPYVNTIYKPSFITDSVNRYLCKSGQQIRILSTQRVGDGFSARNEAKWRIYLYRLVVIETPIDPSICYLDSLIPISELNRCHVIRGEGLDIKAMEEAVNLFKGRHDFASFTSKPVREEQDSNKEIIEFDFKQTNDLFNDKSDHKFSLFTFEIKCKSFLYNQVRRMVGSVIDVGLKRFPLKYIEWLLENPHYKNWNNTQFVAPSKGLWLKDIHYDPKDLLIVDDMGNKVHSVPNKYPNFSEISHFN